METLSRILVDPKTAPYYRAIKKISIMANKLPDNSVAQKQLVGMAAKIHNRDFKPVLFAMYINRHCFTLMEYRGMDQIGRHIAGECHCTYSNNGWGIAQAINYARQHHFEIVNITHQYEMLPMGARL